MKRRDLLSSLWWFGALVWAYNLVRAAITLDRWGALLACLAITYLLWASRKLEIF